MRSVSFSRVKDWSWSLGAIVAGALAAWLIIVAGVFGLALALSTRAEPIVLAERQVRLELSDFEILPNEVDVSPGTNLTLLVVNTVGSAQHDLNISPEVGTGRIKPGDSVLLAVGEVKDSFVVWCSIKGHRELGMEARIELDT